MWDIQIGRRPLRRNGPGRVSVVFMPAGGRFQITADVCYAPVGAFDAVVRASLGVFDAVFLVDNVGLWISPRTFILGWMQSGESVLTAAVSVGLKFRDVLCRVESVVSTSPFPAERFANIRAREPSNMLCDLSNMLSD